MSKWPAGENVLDITNQGNANQNHNEISPHTSLNGFIKKTRDNKCWQGCGEKGILVHCWWEYELVQSLWNTVWRVLKKLKIELPFDPAIPLVCIYPEGNEINISKRYLCSHVHCSIIHNS